MAGLVPAIQVFPSRRGNDVAGGSDGTTDKGVDGRDKPGHDGKGWCVVYFAKSAP
jgi:hypothetical protein